ncbi:hypothetical protein [Cecembia sp.]|uniref:hypothetical protein n=1 Tax=Cecembia sp. TaxID=1898110 RepID=UPI0025B9D2F9|nr:hypothetical protein [Cecembia sp.]
MKGVFIIMVFLGITYQAMGQVFIPEVQDTVQRSIVVLEKRVFEIENNLYQSQKQLKTGIFIATVGYTVTIIGGQLLGTQPTLGETLLYVGGGIGIAGTIVLVKGFNKISLGPPRKVY